MKNKITKTIVMIVFVVFISIIINVKKVSAVSTFVPDEIHHNDTGTVCKYTMKKGSNTYYVITEINNSGNGMFITEGLYKGKFINNWEHDKKPLVTGFRGVDYYETHEERCPEYLLYCEWESWLSDDWYYELEIFVSNENKKNSIFAWCDDAHSAHALTKKTYTLNAYYKVPVKIPADIVLTDEPYYTCTKVIDKDGNTKYYDTKGNVVSESVYKESCATPGINPGVVNPLTNNTIYYSCGGGYLTSIPSSLLRFTSLLYTLFQILVPVALVIICTLDLLKAISSQKEDEIKKGQHLLMKRIIQAIIIFFVFAIVKFFVSVVSNNSDSVIDCVNCFIEGSKSSSCV